MDKFIISTGTSRTTKIWKNTSYTWEQLLDRLQKNTVTPETQGEYRNLPKGKQDAIKDVGGFVGGKLKEGKRKAGYIDKRYLLTLDADFASEDFIDQLCFFADYTWAVYSTHKHTPEKPRYRLLIPLSRPCDPDEYEAVARKVAEDIGIDMFDDTTYQPHRLMYWPSTSIDGEYVFEHNESAPLDVDKTLASYDDWHDVTSWPSSSRTAESRKRLVKKQEDPTTKKGIIGAFCRTYSVEGVINKFLSDVYVPCDVEDRYTYASGSTAAGLVVYEDGKFAYSNHATDPCGGMLCNAFDLVRIHRFGGLDDDAADGTPTVKMPSYKAMQEFAASDDGVKRLLHQERMSSAKSDFDGLVTDDDNDPESDDWVLDLELDKQGKTQASLDNLVLIIRNDKNLKNIAFNRHRDGIDAIGGLPWSQIKDGWNDSDYAALKVYLSKNYGVYSPGRTKDAVVAVATERAYHPIKEYLDNLPEWDGVQRVDTLLIDYFGAEDNIYTRAAIRKTMVAAVARIYHPGTKFDSVLILSGPQGIGKSTFFSKLAGDWFSDSLTITDMRDKSGPEKMQGYWILELGELAGMRKADTDTVKSFISRVDDKYRASYGLTVENHPRQCVIVGSTNAESGFLRDITGNRRFWPVRVSGDSPRKSWQITDDEVEQIWAEALALYRRGEKLYLNSEEEAIATREQREAMETDDREGLVRGYLDTLLPENWDKMSVFERRSFLDGGDFGAESQGTVQRATVCNMEIWCECFGKDQAAMRKSDSYEISAIMQKIDGWIKVDREHVPIYGRQRLYVRSVS